MSALILYWSTAAVFLGLDILGLRYLLYPIFSRHIGHLMAEPPRMGPAAVFYLAYIAGLTWFVSAPALAADDPTAALWAGAALGVLCYGTYEFTNFATLTDWSLEQVVVDCVWGAALTAVSAWAGVVITLAVTG